MLAGPISIVVELMFWILLGILTHHITSLFVKSDYGTVPQRKLKLDCDGKVRVYSLNSVIEKWYVLLQAISNGCLVHGFCGAYRKCGYHARSEKKCLFSSV